MANSGITSPSKTKQQDAPSMPYLGLTTDRSRETNATKCLADFGSTEDARAIKIRDSTQSTEHSGFVTSRNQGAIMTANSIEYENLQDQGTFLSYRAEQDIRKTEETELKGFKSPNKLTLTAREQPYVLRQSVDQLKD